jgi:hypothetical protein
MNPLIRSLWVAMIALTPWSAVAAEPAYQAGVKEVEEIAIDLNKALDKKFVGMLRAQPVSIQQNAVPILRLTEDSATTSQRKVGIVLVSTGFIDLVNRIAHAKAIDRVEKGYFAKYLQAWPSDASSTAMPALPNGSDPKFWAEEIMDQQTTYFCQMMGTALGIKYANYCLGQYAKYAAKLGGPGPDTLPLNKFLTSAEWETALAAGAKNALACAYGVDGIVTLFECVDGMAKRPEWTLFFAPDSSVVKLSKLKRELTKVEKDFFVGG